MRKIAAILLLIIFIFNWFGYRIVANYAQSVADRELEAQLDTDDYDISQLIVLKVPLHMPYQSNWDDFERFDGEIEVEGVHYKYVKRKVHNDSLILLCLPNESKSKIEKAKNNFFERVNDLQSASSPKGAERADNTTIKNILSDYFFNKNNWQIPPPANPSRVYWCENSTLQSLFSKEVSEKPPDC